MNPNQLDPQALNLAKAIRRAETGSSTDPYNARGASGESGAYQFMPDTWKQWAGQYLGNATAEMSVENQNRVAYSRIKELKDQGYNPAQIASMWNSGDKNAYTGVRSDGKTKTVGRIKNSAGVEVDIDVPGYTKKVSQYYNELKGGQATPIGNTQIQTSVQQPQAEGGVLSQLGTATPQAPQEQSKLDFRLQQGGEALGKLAQGVSEGDISRMASGVIQTGGAVAGGALDLVNAGLNAATFGGYDAAMDFVGKKIIAPLFGAAGGGKVVEQWQQFAAENPEAAKNIGAMGNIVSVLPVFQAARKGYVAGKSAVAAGVAKTGFIKTAEEAAKAELRSSAGTTMKGKVVTSARDVKGKEIDPIDTIVDKDYLPTVVNDASGIPRYNTEAARKKIQDNLDLDDDLLDKRLQEAMATQVASQLVTKGRTMASEASRLGYYPVSQMRRDMAQMIESVFGRTLNVPDAMRVMKKKIDSLEGTYGQYVPLTTLRDIKSGVREGVKYGDASTQALEKEVRKQMGRVYMDKIEEMAKERGIADVAEISGRMKADLDAMQALKFFDNRAVTERPGFRTMVGRKSGDAAVIAGESLLNNLVPGVGAFVGKAISNRAISGSGKSVVGKLRERRTRSPLNTSTKIGALGALGINANQEN